ncbi:nuclear transport factor 2 family protein [Streptomyces sp. NPDC048172]|uniref:nuclear transport factor 2 family protein n=1 Tax=Streptomyces sp. NPDC048172 TaxID=3365505 RepID=UPI003721AB4A
MEPTGVIDELWKRMEARDWAGVGELLTEDAVVEWPVTGERIVGRANYVAVNSEYPEGWSIRVLRVVGAAGSDQVVSEVEVPHAELGVFRAASFWTVRDGRVTAAREYWTDVGGEQPPAWRQPYTEVL